MFRRVVENMDDVNYNFQQLFDLLSGNIDGPHIAAKSIGLIHLEDDLLIPGKYLQIDRDIHYEWEGESPPDSVPVYGDEWGLDPDFVKQFPNKIVNSGFEQYDPITMKPLYWEGDGVVTYASNWEGTVALQLEPGQTMEQGEIVPGTFAGADPAWWQNQQTRVSFKQVGGAVRVSVRRYSDDEPYALFDNTHPEHTILGEESLTYGNVSIWPDGHRTFYFSPSAGDGRVKVHFENVGSTDNVYIDAVQMEPDFTGKWPSFYTPGPSRARYIFISPDEPDSALGKEGDIWLRYSEEE